MSAKTYIPGLRLVSAAWDRYAKRWSTRLADTLDAPTYALLLTAITAVDALLIGLGPGDVED